MACSLAKPSCPGEGLAEVKLREGAVRMLAYHFAEGPEGRLDLLQRQIGLPQQVVDISGL